LAITILKLVPVNNTLTINQANAALLGVNCTDNQIDTFTTEGKALFESYFKTYVITNIIFDGITKIKDNVFKTFTSFTNVSLTFTESLTEIGTSAFDNCKGIVGALNLPLSCKYLNNFAFNGCSGITSLSMPGVTSIGV
jgi:hypothetical protein